MTVGEKELSKEEICGVAGCTKPGERSVSSKLAEKAGLNLKMEGRRVHLCKDHYKQFKKATRRERELEMLGR
ncbi:MAG: hypothetical protein QHH00_04600 [Methanomassiliicoccales archaeon]|jgi:hypothetical protein|nr:hypothetical protein [Methanomassiliicoccales archaeon]